MSYFTFCIDDRQFIIFEETLKKYPDSTLFKVTGHDYIDARFIKANPTTFIVDIDPDSFCVIVSCLRGYPFEWEKLDPVLGSKVQIDAQRLNISEMFLQSGGNQDNQPKVEMSVDEVSLIDNVEDMDPEEMLPSYSDEASLSVSSSSDDLLDEDSLDGDSLDGGSIQEMLDAGDRFKPETEDLTELMNLSDGERMKYEQEIEEDINNNIRQDDSSHEIFDTSVLAKKDVSQLDIDNLVQSIQEKLQGPNLLSAINCISTDPNIIRLLRMQKQQAEKGVDTITLSDLMQDPDDDSQIEFVEIE